MFKCWLLAAADWSKISQSASKRSISFSDHWFLIGTVVAVGALGIGLYLWDKHRKRILTDEKNPKSLFFDLCRSHQLSRAERALLTQAAELKQLEQPALMFVDPQLLGSLAGARNPEAEGFRELLGKLFGKHSVE